mmetsp:Transcript_45242/g.102137  ORF Transcript_45242/g.102137 Transcript_45242/m.102137 type:complete len:273 (-) Transcript_45242:147-965(-)
MDGGSHRSTRGGQLTDPRSAIATAGVERKGARQEIADGFDTCAVSGTKFPAAPAPGSIVACALGRLYLRDAVVEYLSKTGQFAEGAGDAARLAHTCGHVERLRDVFSVKLEPNPTRDAVVMDLSESGGGAQYRPGAWCCPVDRAAETNGQHPFVALRPCGHVLRERVSSECSRAAKIEPLPASSGSGSSDADATPRTHKAISDGISTIHGGAWGCPVCTAPVEVSVRLFPDQADVERVQRGLAAARGARAAKKRKRAAGEAETATAATEGGA